MVKILTKTIFQSGYQRAVFRETASFKWLCLAMMEIHQEIIANIRNVIDKFYVGNTRLKLNISA